MGIRFWGDCICFLSLFYSEKNRTKNFYFTPICIQLIGLIEGAWRVSIMESKDRERSKERKGHRECYSKLENVDIYN